MRLISLLLGLVIVAGLVLFYKDSLTTTSTTPEQTFTQQTDKLLQDSHEAVQQLQKTLEEQQRKIQEADPDK